jgi:preprotein translocase subunit SecA
MSEAQRTAELLALRRELRRHGLQADVVARALGAVAALATQALGWVPRETQYRAACALLDNCMVEMATGEGKTLSIGMAAAVAALAGIPVHVVTANEYLAQRDATRLAHWYAALGLRSAAVTEGAQGAARRRIYTRDIVYATAKALAFDFLRDRPLRTPAHDLARATLRLSGEAPALPVLPGLCMALLDEADSILLDEAEVPLILSRRAPHAARRAFLWQALALARQLRQEVDFRLNVAERTATLTAAGDERLAALAAGLGGPWLRPRYRREAVQVALLGLHGCVRNEHYLVRDGAIALLDEVTGRVAAGRMWSRGLQTVVALKEGIKPPDDTDTVAQTTFQRFFQGYWRLSGISGTLWEGRAELREIFDAPVVRIPLHRPCVRKRGPSRRWPCRASAFTAVARRVAELTAAGRPVLVGTDGVDDSQALSAELTRQGIAHRLLDALHDADEASVVAHAGRAGRVTVATRMAGRGTDIKLDAAARAAGGLHVLSCQHNPSHRQDRQLAGRAGRHGDPGSEEAWYFGRNDAKVSRETADRPYLNPNSVSREYLSWIIRMSRRWLQWREDRRRRAARRHLLEQDRQAQQRLSFTGRPD